jgi:hypothetical protein
LNVIVLFMLSQQEWNFYAERFLGTLDFAGKAEPAGSVFPEWNAA